MDFEAKYDGSLTSQQTHLIGHIALSLALLSIQAEKQSKIREMVKQSRVAVLMLAVAFCMVFLAMALERPESKAVEWLDRRHENEEASNVTHVL